MADPFYIQWHITNFCNLRCQHCYQEDFSRADDLDWLGLKTVSDGIIETLGAWARRACIHLTGGEPLLKPEIFPLLEYLDSKPEIEELGLITNGLYLDDDITERLSLVSKLGKIKVSLDGPNAETNDSIRRPGVFDRVVERLAVLCSRKRFEVTLMFTVMKTNYRDLADYLRLLEQMDVDGLILERFVPWGRGRGYQQNVLESSEWNQVVRTLLEFFSAEEESNSFLPFQAFHVRSIDGDMELLGAPCIIGEDGVCVMPDATVFPCRRFPVSVGNLLHDRLGRIWETSAILNALRRKENLKGKCGSCDIAFCRGCRSLALSLSGDYLAEDPHCCYQPKRRMLSASRLEG
jgi:MoaA/NifB/PqqE/SkfB family radical SAM enzyme